MKIKLDENYTQEVQEAKDLLSDPKATYSQLLDKLCELERTYGKLKNLIVMGFNEDMITLWKVAAIANEIKFKIKHRVKQLADKRTQ
jgi:hypothetical protein